MDERKFPTPVLCVGDRKVRLATELFEHLGKLGID